MLDSADGAGRWLVRESVPWGTEWRDFGRFGEYSEAYAVAHMRAGDTMTLHGVWDTAAECWALTVMPMARSAMGAMLNTCFGEGYSEPDDL